MPKAFTEADRERIRSRLLSAGKSILNRVGVRQLVIEDVARDAGISKGSFYAFFPSREDFILTVFEAWETEFRTELFAQILGEAGTIRDRWEAFFRGAFAILDREPGLARLGSRDIQQLTDRLPPDRLAAHQAEDQRVMEETFGRLVSRGVLETRDRAALPGIVMAIFAMCLYRKDFPPAAWDPAVGLMAEALALRLTPSEPARGGPHD